MNKKFLSRGKRKDTGKWVEGYFIEQDDPEYHAYIIQSFKAEIDNRHIDILECVIEEVIPETVGRCTGLLDKNGKMIFEGDIIRADVQRFIVKFGKCGGVENIDGDVGYMGFYITPVNVKYAKCFRTDILFWINAYGAEVIGNIHDDPELIGGNTNET